MWLSFRVVQDSKRKREKPHLVWVRDSVANAGKVVLPECRDVFGYGEPHKAHRLIKLKRWGCLSGQSQVDIVARGLSQWGHDNGCTFTFLLGRGQICVIVA
jgi:hypothetical protein